jgi:hypothetical protein
VTLTESGQRLRSEAEKVPPAIVARLGMDGSVALAEGVIVQAGLMSHRPAAVAVPRSSFAGFRFPPG